MVTSSAVVGSSAISRRGLQAIAIAIITRWFMPPESWCGKALEPASRRPGCRPARAARRRASRAALRSSAQVQAQRLGELEADREARVEARRRLLEDHRDVLADEPAALARRTCASRSRPAKRSRSARDAAGQGDEAHQRQHGDALARARLADDAERPRPRRASGSTPSTACSAPRLRSGTRRARSSISSSGMRRPVTLSA